MNDSLTKILEIYRLVSHNLYTVDRAYRETGEKYRIEPSALRASCTAALNITDDMMETFLKADNTFNFKNFLIRRFPENNSEIIRFFNMFDSASDIPVLDLTKVFKTASYNKSPQLGSDHMINDLENSLQDWVARNDIPQDLRDEFKGWIKKIDPLIK